MENKNKPTKQTLENTRRRKVQRERDLEIIESQFRVNTIKELVSQGVSFDPAQIVTWQEWAKDGLLPSDED